MLRFLRRLFRADDPPTSKLDEFNSFEQLCVCSEEFCFCSNMVRVPNAVTDLAAMGVLIGGARIPCDACRDGQHRWSP